MVEGGLKEEENHVRKKQRKEGRRRREKDNNNCEPRPTRVFVRALSDLPMQMRQIGAPRIASHIGKTSHWVI
jgi:hypothetical protein